MTIHVITEPEYNQSTWCNAIQKGLIERAMHKRIKIQVETCDFHASEDDVISIIATSSDWIYNAVNKTKSTYSVPIVLISNRPSDLAVNNICTDLYSAMKDVLLYLKHCKKTETALFGVNPSSLTDSTRLTAFTDKNKVYYNFGNLIKCCQAFFEDIEKYDSVICTNDFAAISLLNYLKKYAPAFIDKLYIVSFGDSRIAQRYKPTITSVSQNYSDYGMSLIEILPFITKIKNTGYITLNVKSKIIPRETTHNIPTSEDSVFTEKVTLSDTGFYNDNEIKKLIKTEKLLDYCNEKDISIIKSLLDGNSYEKTAASLFFSVNGIKYRLKRLCYMCGIENVKELLNLANVFMAQHQPWQKIE